MHLHPDDPTRIAISQHPLFKTHNTHFQYNSVPIGGVTYINIEVSWVCCGCEEVLGSIMFLRSRFAYIHGVAIRGYAYGDIKVDAPSATLYQCTNGGG